MDIDADRIDALCKNIRSILPEEEKRGYDVFSVLGVAEKEVIMCRMLADLLNPRGRHGLGDRFLRSFLTKVLHEADALADIDKLHVTKEYPIRSADDGPAESSGTKAGDGADDRMMPQRIDIVIHGAGHFIPIEVKINETEHGCQCLDYYHFAHREYQTPCMYYMTKYGTPPENSNSALGAACRRISFATDILPWLWSVVGEADWHKGNDVFPIIRQYLSSIEHFTDVRRRNTMENCAARVMKTDIEAGIAIAKSFPVIQDSLIKGMFEEFEKAIQREWKLEPDNKAENYWRNVNESFFGDIFSGQKYASKNPCTCFKIKSENTSGDPSLYIRIDWRVWAELGSGGKTSWMYLPTGEKDDKASEIPDFYTMNSAAIKLNDSENLNSFIAKSMEAIEREFSLPKRNDSIPFRCIRNEKGGVQ